MSKRRARACVTVNAHVLKTVRRASGFSLLWQRDIWEWERTEAAVRSRIQSGKEPVQRDFASRLRSAAPAGTNIILHVNDGPRSPDSVHLVQ
ncbi:hypothetical protein CHARACLAT_008582 [Characodon lateralis]|uniref:Uncharacterized protein n=1 Tax=Characodon lateralis TaxID=208331 RepID=A0ABU7ES11_9TELE|nr:hypothetical protein [Characodon lateralis]